MMVFQEFDQLLPWKTVLGNVLFPLLNNRRMPKAEATEHARAVIAKVNLSKFENVYPHMLSGGMKQRVAIARALAMEPKVLLMDEPFAALDALTRRKMQEELKALWDDVGFTVLFVTHSIEEALLVGSRILVHVAPPRPREGRAERRSSRLRRHRHARLREGAPPHPRSPVRRQDRDRARHGDAQWLIPRNASSAWSRRGAPSAWSSSTRWARSAMPRGRSRRPSGCLQITGVRRLIVVVVLCLAWQLYAMWLQNNLLFPTLGETLEALYDAVFNGPLVQRTLTSLQILLTGYAAGLAIAGIFTTLAITTRVGTDFLSTLTAMFNPLPAIALLPLALLWFGLGAKSLVFVIIHSVLWAVALNTHSGFTSVSPTLRMAGQNCGLRGISYVAFLLVPAAFPSILTGLKIGWAFAWRTLIAAELVFGVSSRSGGLGWFIFENRNQLEIPSVFAGLLTVIVIGLLVESVIFRSIENVTIRRWGMQS